jgi:hypothetical protein
VGCPRGRGAAAIAALECAGDIEPDKAPFAALMRPVWDQFITSPAQRSVVERVLAMREVA